MENRYSKKSEAELHYICKDAGEAAVAARSLGNLAAECKYLDQVNDACSELYRRKAVKLSKREVERISK